MLIVITGRAVIDFKKRFRSAAPIPVSMSNALAIKLRDQEQCQCESEIPFQLVNVTMHIEFNYIRPN